MKLILLSSQVLLKKLMIEMMGITILMLLQVWTHLVSSLFYVDLFSQLLSWALSWKLLHLVMVCISYL